ncbi:MAG: putative glutathione S-transferase-related transrane protein [Devosia sp.]|uniref:SRPBCC family protein n=1 Tax=Devosia sp. TaxID=1871048 RepID=UPI00261494AF|nr:SRPBCC family protein [Devosia sp.]MDB5528651.1 putative glutathione S-transferase-related transrane protein [Devosia sp.]
MDDLKITSGNTVPTVTITRTFNAPRALVWKAMSQPEHIIRWFGPNRHTNRVIHFDWRIGGSWKIETTTPEGQVILFHGNYLEIVPPERTVQTFGVEGMFDGKMATETLTLKEAGDRTIYSVTSRFDTVEERDGMLASGMEYGVREGFKRLDQILEEFKAKA